MKITDEMIDAARSAIRYLNSQDTPWSDEQVSAILTAALSAMPAAQASGLSKWNGWDQSNMPWSKAKHQDAVCRAVFGDGWSMEDASTLIGFINQTWGDSERVLSAMPAVRVKVKPLEWNFDTLALVWRASCPIGHYTAWSINGHAFFGFNLTAQSPTRIEGGGDEEASKAAAQADYEARVLSAIEPGGVETPPPSTHVVPDVKVKALEFLLTGRNNVFHADEGVYVVAKETCSDGPSAGWTCWRNNRRIGFVFSTDCEAMDAAQADYERCILSAIEEAAAPAVTQSPQPRGSISAALKGDEQ